MSPEQMVVFLLAVIVGILTGPLLSELFMLVRDAYLERKARNAPPPPPIPTVYASRRIGAGRGEPYRIDVEPPSAS